MPAFEIGKNIVNLADQGTSRTLEGIRNLFTNSLDWSAEQLKNLSDAPLVKQSELAQKLRESSEKLKATSKESSDALIKALNATSEAFGVSREFLELTKEDTRKSLFENIFISSIVGDSFADMVNTSDIKASFRRRAMPDEKFGADISPAQAARDLKESGLKRAVFCVPGLLCDEGVWSGSLLLNDIVSKKEKEFNELNKPDSAQPHTIDNVFEKLGIYPLYFRFNPGLHISQNGLGMLELIQEFFDQPEIKNTGLDIKFDMISYSQGGLVLRSALYQARQKGYKLSNRLNKVILVSSPDGGSYLEKLGFWLGMGLENMPLPIVKTIGFIGNQRSDGIKDLSHGIIREEDWKGLENHTGGHKERYTKENYFGELDDIDAFQIYSLIYDKKDSVKSWLGDGIVEDPSLSYLSNRVYRNKKQADERVHCITGINHFQIIQDPQTMKILDGILK